MSKNRKAGAGLAAASGYERTSKTKPISLSEARKIFAAVAPDVKTCEAHACKSLERTRYWNWFRMGIVAAQKGRVTKNDVRWVNGSPWLKAHNDLLSANIENTNMKTKKLGKVERTSRGFEVVNFKDHYGTSCSLQASSLAIYEKPGTSAIWLGVDDANPQCLHGDAAGLGIKTDATCGWVKYPLSNKVMLTTRMHLNREQVEALIPMLQSWLKRDTFKVKAST